MTQQLARGVVLHYFNPKLKSVIHHYFCIIESSPDVIFTCQRLPIPPTGRAQRKTKTKTCQECKQWTTHQTGRGNGILSLFKTPTFSERKIIGAKIVAKMFAYLVEKKTGPPINADLKEDTLITENQAQNSLQVGRLRNVWNGTKNPNNAAAPKVGSIQRSQVWRVKASQ